jgi:beta-glucosidase
MNNQTIQTVNGNGDNIRYVNNPGGPKLGYSPESGVTIIEQDGLYFKDLSRDGKLDRYEDWRLSPKERAKDLASKMTVEQMAGLMLYSRHQSIPAASGGWFSGTYGGKSYEESGMKPWELTDEQLAFLVQDHVRHILVTTVESPEVAARWNNKVQAYAEGTGLGIPARSPCGRRPWAWPLRSIRTSPRNLGKSRRKNIVHWDLRRPFPRRLILLQSRAGSALTVPSAKIRV